MNIKEFPACGGRIISLDVSLEAFPPGMFPNQSAMNPEEAIITFIGVDDKGVIYYSNPTNNGLVHWKNAKSKKEFEQNGFIFSPMAVLP